jgi:hypothetical protein
MSESINVYKAHVFSEDVLEDVVLYADHVRELKELKEELQEERNQKHFCSQVDDMYDDLKQQLATARAEVWEQAAELIKAQSLTANNDLLDGCEMRGTLLLKVKQQAQQAREGSQGDMK